MNTSEHFWIFTHLGLGDSIACNALFRHYAEVHKDKVVIIPCWERNLASIQWMLSDVPNIFFYPIETEHQLLTCKASIKDPFLSLGFYAVGTILGKETQEQGKYVYETFKPVKWDSEFYRQAGLDPELKWKGFKLPEFNVKPLGIPKESNHSAVVVHFDKERGFNMRQELLPPQMWLINKDQTLMQSVQTLWCATEIHCIDSSMLNLADLMETPYCKRFVFHRYARKGLPPQLRKPWEIID